MINKKFIFTVDDNVRFLKELNDSECQSIFEHPYMAMYKRLHEKYGVKVQLNLFYEAEGFDLSMMTNRYKPEWKENSKWLKMSFHSRRENVKPYEHSGYSEVSLDRILVENAIVRFAGLDSLAKTTTIHYCLLTPEGIKAATEMRTTGLLGLYGTKASPRTSYQTEEADAARIRDGEIIRQDGIAYGGIDIVLNMFSEDEILIMLDSLIGRDHIKVMIHEQYFYPDYRRYQPDFEQKLEKTFRKLRQNGYAGAFFEDII